jgi:TRAP transporter TAXI family solute receptor
VTTLSSGFVLAMLVACAACHRAPVEQTEPLIVLTGGSGGSFYPLGDKLVGIFNRAVPTVRATMQSTVASIFNVRAIQESKAEVAFTQADVAYLAYRDGIAPDTFPFTRLRGMAVLWINTVQLVVSRGSTVRSVRDLRGRRVGVGEKESGTELAARIVIEGHGLKYSDLQPEFLSFSEVVSHMQQGTLDAGFVVASYPVTAVEQMNSSLGVRLIPIQSSVVNHIRDQYPFMRAVTIPKNTYAGQSVEITTVGVDNILVCRADLPEDLVYRLTKSLFDALPELARTDAAAALVDPDEGPITPIPLHPGAARYYREREVTR